MPRERKQGDTIVILSSVHEVLAAERALKGERIWCDLVPVPRQVSSACGVCLSLFVAELQPALGALRQAGLKHLGGYRHLGGGRYIRVAVAPA